MKKIQDIYKSLGEHGSLLLCYLHEACVKADIVKHFEELTQLDIIDNDCNILDANRLLKFFGSDKRVVIGTNENGNTIVPYKYRNAEHFVVVNERVDFNKEIVFNSLENSTCVRLGEPVWDKARYLA